MLHALEVFKGLLDKYRDAVDTFGHFPSLFLGRIADDGTGEHCGERLRIVDRRGRTSAAHIDAARYGEYIAEAIDRDTSAA